MASRRMPGAAASGSIDRQRSELVYLPNLTRHFSMPAEAREADAIRFRVELAQGVPRHLHRGRDQTRDPVLLGAVSVICFT